jgi:hypothetical protein
MPSQFEDMLSEIGTPLLMEKLGGPLTRYPAGVMADAIAGIAAIVEWDETEKDFDRGQGVKTRGQLHLAAGVTVTDEDTWLINGLVYSVETVGPALGGMRVVKIVLRTSKRTTSQSTTRSTR